MPSDDPVRGGTLIATSAGFKSATIAPSASLACGSVGELWVSLSGGETSALLPCAAKRLPSPFRREWSLKEGLSHAATTRAFVSEPRTDSSTYIARRC